MRVTTSQSFDRPSLLMSTLNKQADRLQIEVATGKKIQAPSDDAASWSQLSTLRRADADDASYAGNIKTAQGLLAQSDTTLGQIETQVQRAKALAIQANSAQVSPQDREAIKVEVEAILADVFALANSKDSRGHPLFGGADGDSAYTMAADGTISYAGSGEPNQIPIGDGVTIAATTSGDRAFGGIATADGESDMFAILAGFVAALASDAPAGAIEKSMGELDATLDQLSNTRTSIGARAFRMDLEAERLDEAAIRREDERSGIEDADLATTITELQQTLTVLQATQASFSKLTSLSLFDYLR